MSETTILDSVLNSVKEYSGINVDDTSFDTDLIVDIKSSLMSLRRLGVKSNITITDGSQKWSDLFSTSDAGLLDSIKTFVCCKTKMIFDTPTNTNVKEALQSIINETEWTIANWNTMIGGEQSDG